jgi:hypothetical protein
VLTIIAGRTGYSLFTLALFNSPPSFSFSFRLISFASFHASFLLLL